jgi:hypothetical protein
VFLITPPSPPAVGLLHRSAVAGPALFRRGFFLFASRLAGYVLCKHSVLERLRVDSQNKSVQLFGVA